MSEDKNTPGVPASEEAHGLNPDATADTPPPGDGRQQPQPGMPDRLVDDRNVAVDGARDGR